MNEEKEALLRVLINATKTLLSTNPGNLKEFYMDHDTQRYNLKLEITER
jgi:hypothetical protein